MTTTVDPAIYTNIKGLAELKRLANTNSSDALPTVAKQFEGIFLQLMLKTMREANKTITEDSMLQSDTVDFYQEMFDKQVALHLASQKGMGLSEVLVKQLDNAQPEDRMVNNVAEQKKWLQKSRSV